MSIKIYQTGSVAGITGTTLFILEGKKWRGTYIDKFLLTKGSSIGSTIIMKPTAFMEEEARENSRTKIIEGLRNSDPIVKANLQ